jgi:putative peptidoglycan lipid II flippase
MKDTIQTIRRSSHRFFSGTLLSRLTGMLRDMSMAYVFGTQPSIAAFMVAFRFAHLLRRLFGEGALQSAFIPEFETLRYQQEQRAFIFFRDLSLTLTVFLILLIGLISGVLGSFVLWGDLKPANQEIITLTLFMLPSLLFICLFGLNTSLLQCEKSYFIPSVAPVAFNGVWIVAIFYLREMPVEQAMPWLSLGVVIGCFFQWILTVPQTLKSLSQILSSSFWHSLNLTSKDLRLLGKPLALGILGVAASQINNAIDSLYARFAEIEGPALLWYAIRIQQLPLALFGIAIAGALLPPLTRARKAQRLEEYRHFLSDALFRSWFFMLPLTAALFVMGDTFVKFLYGRGDFGSHSVVQTTYCLWAYAIGLIPSALVLILAPASYAQSNYRLPAYASFLTLLLNLFLNTLFIMYFGWGAISVAIATSISAWINLLLLGWNLSRIDHLLFPYSLLKKGMPVSLATLGALYGTYEMRINLQSIPFFSESLLTDSTFMATFSILSYQFLTFGGLFCLVFFSILLIRRIRLSFFHIKKSEGVKKSSFNVEIS